MAMSVFTGMVWLSGRSGALPRFAYLVAPEPVASELVESEPDVVSELVEPQLVLLLLLPLLLLLAVARPWLSAGQWSELVQANTD